MDAGDRAREKRRRFLLVAERRTRNVLKQLQVLGNCANRASYDYTAEDVRKIFAAVEQRLAIVKDKFEDRRQLFTLQDTHDDT